MPVSDLRWWGPGAAWPCGGTQPATQTLSKPSVSFFMTFTAFIPFMLKALLAELVHTLGVAQGKQGGAEGAGVD